MLNTRLVPLKSQYGLQDDRAATVQDSGRETEHPYGPNKVPAVVPFRPWLASRQLSFPSDSDCEQYLAFFFDDINACHPVVNEADFRTKSAQMVSSFRLSQRTKYLLALHYIIFACADVLLHVSRDKDPSQRPGRRWYRAASELVENLKSSGHGDISLVQYLVLEAFYLVHTDQAMKAYRVSGLACRLCFQLGLHQQSQWEEPMDCFATHMKQRILWTTFFVDRRIALSCGLPFGMSERDIEVELPAWIPDRDLHPDKPLAVASLEDSATVYLSCMVSFARLGGEVWDRVYSAKATRRPVDPESIAILDAKIKHYIDDVLPTMPLLASSTEQPRKRLRQHALVNTRFSHLRLLLRRRAMVSLNFSAQDGRLCGDLASDIVAQILQHRDEATQASSFRFHMATSLGWALLVLGAVLCKSLDQTDAASLNAAYAQAFQQGLELLKTLSSGLQLARRMLRDLTDIIRVAEVATERLTSKGDQNTEKTHLNGYHADHYANGQVTQHTPGFALPTTEAFVYVQQAPYSGFEMSWDGWNDLDLGGYDPVPGYGVSWI